MRRADILVSCGASAGRRTCEPRATFRNCDICGASQDFIPKRGRGGAHAKPTNEHPVNKTIWPALVLGLSIGGAYAADPDSGTLTDNGEHIEFTGGPFVGANTFGQAGDSDGIDPVFACDHFTLTIDLPDDYVERYPTALIRISTLVTEPGAGVREDYDLYLYDEDGSLVAEGVSERDPEFIVLLAQPGLRSYLLRIVPFTATASSYTTIIELSPGVPAEDIEARSMSIAAGSLGGGLLVLAALGLRRSR